MRLRVNQPKPSSSHLVRDEHRRGVLTATAAKELGVGQELLNGLLFSKKIAGYAGFGKTGAPVWFIYADQLVKFRNRMAAMD